MLLSYGMSLSEYLGIMVKDIDFENLTVSINKGAVIAPAKSSQFMIVSEPKNAHRNRQIAITKETADWLKTCTHKYISNPESDDVMKSTVFRYAYKAFMQRMHDYYMQDNIDIPILNPHELRHSRASLWVNEGRSLFAIAEMLGWSDLKMLRSVYGHPDIQELRKNLNL
jgi:integrase